jgi:hypothetical protein
MFLAVVIFLALGGVTPAAAGCGPPQLAVDVTPRVVGRGEAFTISGTGFVAGCPDVTSVNACTGERQTHDEFRPAEGVRLTLEQNSRRWSLGTVDADENYTVLHRAHVPSAASPGRATVFVESLGETLRTEVEIVERVSGR